MKSLVFAKYLICKGDNATEKPSPLSSVALLHYHDSLEILFDTILKEKEKKFKRNANSTFLNLFNRVNEILGEDEKSNQKGSLSDLNSLRKGLKHNGTFVTKEDIEKSKYTANNTFKELCEKVYNYSFDEISLSYLIKNKKVVNNLNDAIKSFQNNKTNTINKLAKSFKSLLEGYQEVNELNSTHFFYSLEQYKNDANDELIDEIDRTFSDIINHMYLINDTINTLSLGLDYKKYGIV